MPKPTWQPKLSGIYQQGNGHSPSKAKLNGTKTFDEDNTRKCYQHVSPSFIYSASTISIKNETLLDLMMDGSANWQTHAQEFPKLIARAAYIERNVLEYCYANKSQKWIGSEVTEEKPPSLHLDFEIEKSLRMTFDRRAPKRSKQAH